MSAEHTPGRLEQEQRKGSDGMWRTEIFSSEHGGVAAVCDWAPMPAVNGITGSFRAGNARRLVACWNACDGISTEALEIGAIQDRIASACGELYEAKKQCAELLAALKAMLDEDDGGRAADQARAAIAKTEAAAAAGAEAGA